MAVPKRKTSRARTRMRRAQWKAEHVTLTEATIDGGRYRLPRRLVAAARRGLLDSSTLDASRVTTKGP
ncbi:50S ribosomal protein L32 [Demequina sp. NBRC 110052]|uniref:50S ribosomal protein L32 n=1 Tax=Demequina sp. NBRC 110052 TaxID=1570341 RepID=UPI000A055EB0|nr:50S ribosomal protein L32 [Demequina sp. NBRC 110052]